MDRTEELIVQQLREGREEAFRFLYDHHYAILCHIAASYVHDDFLSETIVSDVIFHIWEIRQRLQIKGSLRAYLVQSVRHRCLDYLKSQVVERERSLDGMSVGDWEIVKYIRQDDYPLGRLLENELEDKIAEAIDRLPEESRRVFKLSRFDGKKNEEIAHELNISINTVKYHLKQALRLLRQDLSRYLISLLLVFIQN
jgi:RNA polymerase sigma-70 factor (ECF subfamily)